MIIFFKNQRLTYTSDFMTQVFLLKKKEKKIKEDLFSLSLGLPVKLVGLHL